MRAGGVGKTLTRLANLVYVKVVGLGEAEMQPDKMSEEEIREKLGLVVVYGERLSK